MHQSRSTRGPLRAILLAATGQDVRLCANCGDCEAGDHASVDLTYAQIFQAAARNDAIALTNATLRASKHGTDRDLHCQAGLNIPELLKALMHEADLRSPGLERK